MSMVETSVDVNVDVTTAYNQWTQFESFPQFMENVVSVKQLDDRHMHWVAEIAGQEREWDAEITEQIPDKRIAWTSVSGEANGGLVNFESLSGSKCRITLRMDYGPKGALERAGDSVGLIEKRVREDLQRFKSFIEARGEASGAWRDEIAV